MSDGAKARARSSRVTGASSLSYGYPNICARMWRRSRICRCRFLVRRRRAIPVRTALGASPLAQMRYVPLSALAQIEIAPGPNQISREDGKRRIVVSANVRERDLGTFVTDAQQQIAEKIKLPAGYWIGWGGQFEQLASATQRLTIVVPIALLLIFLLLVMSLGSAADAALVFSGVPLALTGGIAATILTLLVLPALYLLLRRETRNTQLPDNTVPVMSQGG